MAKRLTRAVVVAHAADLSDEIGFHELTITKLGRSLEIAPPGVYRHVADLVDLRHAISRLVSQEVATILSASCAGLAGASALAALATALRRWAVEHPGRYAALQFAPDADDADGQAATETVLIVIGSALQAYRLEGDDLIDAIRVVRSTLHGFISLELNGGFKQPRGVDVTFGRLISSLDTALSQWTG